MHDDAEMAKGQGDRRRRRWARVVFVGACSVLLGYLGLFEYMRHDAQARPGSGIAGAVLLMFGGPIVLFVIALLGAVLVDLGRRALTVWLAGLTVVLGVWVLASLDGG